MKPRLISDVINIVNPLPFDRLALSRLLEARLQSGCWPSKTKQRDDVSSKESINSACFHVLRGLLPRLYGQPVPKDRLGLFECVAPSHNYTRLSKLRGTATLEQASVQLRDDVEIELPLRAGQPIVV